MRVTVPYLPMLDLSSARFAFLDLETTGLSPWFGDRICEVGIVLTEGRRIKQQVQMLVNPEHPLSLGAASTSGLTDEQLSTAASFADVAHEIVEFRRLGREIQIPNLVDTLLLARQNFELPSYSLHYLAEAFHVPMVDAHRALPDAHTGRGVFFAIMDSLKQYKKPLDEYIGIYKSPVWPNDGIQLPTELGEAIYSNKRMFIRYVNGEGIKTERWITPKQVMGLSDYVYLKAHCHLRNDERNFRLDRIIEVKIEK